MAAVEAPDPGRVRFRLKQPWPDFMTFYGTPATGAGWIVPKKYVEKLGEEGFKIHEKVMYLPIWQLAVLQGYGPRVAESGLGLITDYPWSAPYEDLRLKTR